MSRTLTQRLASYERLQVADRIGGATEVQLQVQAFFVSATADFDQTVDLDPGIVGVEEIGERITAPEPQRLVEQLARSLWIPAAPSDRVQYEVFEPCGVDAVIGNAEDVAGRSVLEIEAVDALAHTKHE